MARDSFSIDCSALGTRLARAMVFLLEAVIGNDASVTVRSGGGVVCLEESCSMARGLRSIACLALCTRR